MSDKIFTHETINTLTVKQVADILREYGVKTSEDSIRKRILNKQYTFGAAHVGETGNVECTIYAKPFTKWLCEVVDIKLIKDNGLSDWKPGGEQ